MGFLRFGYVTIWGIDSFGFGVIVCIVCYGTVWPLSHVFSFNVGL